MVWKSEIINSQDLRPGHQLPAAEVIAAGQVAWRTWVCVGWQDRSLVRGNKYPDADEYNRLFWSCLLTEHNEKRKLFLGSWTLMRHRVCLLWSVHLEGCCVTALCEVRSQFKYKDTPNAHFKCALLLANLKCASQPHIAHLSIPKCFAAALFLKIQLYWQNTQHFDNKTCDFRKRAVKQPGNTAFRN